MLSSESSNKTIYWTSVGVQQWGYGYGYKSSKTTTLPIAFSTQKYCVIAGTTYESNFYQVPACVRRNDNSLTTIDTGVYSGSATSQDVVAYAAIGR